MLRAISIKAAVGPSSGSKVSGLIVGRIAQSFMRVGPVLLPLVVLIGTGLRGLDFGVHWDEKGYQIAPVETMVKTGILLPQYYGYPSFDYWVNLAGLIPDMLEAWPEKGNVREKVVKATEKVLDATGSYQYLMRLRAIYVVGTALAVLWVYVLVLHWRQSWVQAFLAASFLAFSWEVAYHSRWVATDGMLMQFGALTFLFTVFSWIRRDRHIWIKPAAIAAGLAFGTKFPGGLLLVPVFIGAYLTCDKMQTPVISYFIKLAVIFACTYLITTPATVLHPTRFLAGVLYELMGHYSLGHAGHTVSAGLEHGWRMLTYLSLVIFSPFAPIAFLLFALAVVGGYALLKESPKTATLVLSFPILYLIYFSTQRAMIVRNLLVVVPFLAILAAIGTSTIWKHLKPTYRERSFGCLQLNLPQAGLAIVILTSLLMNASWLVYAAETIRDRKTDRFIREAASYVMANKNQRFFLSPLAELKLTQGGSIRFPNVTDDWTKADHLILYVSEGMTRWQDWPANKRLLTKTWFGPYEVNFNIYPNWWGDDRIIVMSVERAKEIGIVVLNISNAASGKVLSAETPERVVNTIFPSTHPREINQSKVSWVLPGLDPCQIVTKIQAEASIGPLRADPAPRGHALDGTSCTYISAEPVIVRINLISTAAFELQKHHPENTTLIGLGSEAYTIEANSVDDAHLFVRKDKAAIMVSVFTQSDHWAGKRFQIAQDIAVKALAQL